MPTNSPLLREAAACFGGKDLDDVRDAEEMARRMYAGEERSIGEPLIIHVEKIARLLLRLHPDSRTIVAALLQHAEGPTHRALIERRFGKKIVRTISAVAVLERGSGKAALYSPAYLRKMMLALSEDIRVLLICLHNRWHLLESPHALEEKQRRAIAREALDVFAPISARLGVYSLKYALETLAFAALFPEEAREIEEQLRHLRKREGPFLQESTRAMKRILAREGKRVEIIGREKHPYSIFGKMERKGLNAMTALHDLFGLRILVDTIEDCYQVLGITHRTYRPIPHRLKDYIAFPKPNGYRSIHTTVLGLNVRDPALPVEVQIRTHAMDDEAEYGIAAHWNYKEHGSEHPLQHQIWQERVRALRELSTAHGEGAVEEKHPLSEMFSDRIYVLTPRGDPVELPKGATPLDFAFRVHTDIGLCFKAALVNGTVAPITQRLENGDMVEILRRKDPRPSAQWITIVRTHEARSKLRAFFRAEKESALPSHPAAEGSLRAREQRETREDVIRKQSSSVPHAAPLVQLEAETALPHRFAKCCHPEEVSAARTPIIGFISRIGTVNIHRRTCRMLAEANPERFVQAHWGRGTNGSATKKRNGKERPTKKAVTPSGR